MSKWPCKTCGEAIPEKRLELWPHAVTCSRECAQARRLQLIKNSYVRTSTAKREERSRKLSEDALTDLRSATRLVSAEVRAHPEMNLSAAVTFLERHGCTRDLSIQAACKYFRRRCFFDGNGNRYRVHDGRVTMESAPAP